MKKIGELTNQITQGMSLDSDVIRTYLCPGCEEIVQVEKMTMLFGPKKGQTVEIQNGCKCEEIAIVNQLLKEREEARKKKILNTFDQNSLINDGLKMSNFENYRPTNQTLTDAKQAALQFVNTFNKEKPQNLLFTGTYGVGKSHLSVAIIKALMKKDFTSIFISVPKLLTKLKATYNKKSEHTEDELLSTLEYVDVLVLDDIGSEHSGREHSESWAVSKVFEVVDSRIGKHTIYTTNLNGVELRDKIGPRNFSRMMQDTEIIKMQGEDYRLRGFK